MNLLPEIKTLCGVAAGVVVGVLIARATRSSATASASLTAGKCKAKENKTLASTDHATAVVTIEYCTGCRWMMRAGWTAQELLTTFAGHLAEVTLKPNSSRPGGAFEIYRTSTTFFIITTSVLEVYIYR